MARAHARTERASLATPVRSVILAPSEDVLRARVRVALTVAWSSGVAVGGRSTSRRSKKELDCQRCCGSNSVDGVVPKKRRVFLYSHATRTQSGRMSQSGTA